MTSVGYMEHRAPQSCRSMALPLYPKWARTFSGKTLEEALAWCLVWLMALELGIGSFLI